MIGIIDYGAGNLRSVLNAFSFISCDAKIVQVAAEIAKCDRLILPGVGAFKSAMDKLKINGLDEAILRFIDTERPFLGVCLGMQLMFEKSFEFGENMGLGILKGEVRRFDENRFSSPLKVPHMGWNVCKKLKDSRILKGLNEEFYLYFVHSYHIVATDLALISTNYGYEFISGVQKDNIFGFQPHPEKSHENGLKIIKNFTEL